MTKIFIVSPIFIQKKQSFYALMQNFEQLKSEGHLSYLPPKRLFDVINSSKL